MSGNGYNIETGMGTHYSVFFPVCVFESVHNQMLLRCHGPLFLSYRREKGIYMHTQTCCTCMLTAALLVINCCIIKYLGFVPGSWEITSKSLDFPWAIGVLVACAGAWPHLSLCKWDDSGWGLVMQETPTLRCQPDLKGWGGGEGGCRLSSISQSMIGSIIPI